MGWNNRWLLPLLWCLPLWAGAGTPRLTLELQPATPAMAERLRAGLTLARRGCDTPQWRLSHDRLLARRELKEGLRAFGYYQPVIEQSFSQAKECWALRFHIELGTPVRISQVNIELTGAARTDPDFRALLADPGLRVGQRLEHEKYEAIKARLLSLAGARGYLDARFTRHELRVDPVTHQAWIELAFDSGGRYRISKIRFQVSGLEPEFIRSLFPIHAGDWYSSEGIAKLDRALTESGYFASVEVKPLLNEMADQRIPLQLELHKRKRHRWRLGAGADTNTGPRLSLEYENRYASSSGDSLSMRLRTSPVESELGVEYRIPMADPLNQQLSLRGGYQREDTDTTRSDQYSLGLRHSRTRGNWIFNQFIDLSVERSTVADLTQQATLLIPGVSLDGVIADRRLKPNRGLRLNGELKGGHDRLLSDVSFLQLKLRAKGVYRLFASGRLIGRVELGGTLTDDFEQLPASLRFFAGGDNSVRGYGYKTLGPERDGQVVGGQNLLTASIEYEQHIHGNWSLALFSDAGNAFDGDSFRLQRSLGVGVRWDWQVARLRIDLAFPEDTSKDDFRIHFSMGTDL